MLLSTMRPIIYHIPVCPFSQRLEIILDLKGMKNAVDFQTIDITVPRPDWLLGKTGGSTALPVMDMGKDDVGKDKIMKESLVIMRYLDEAYDTMIARSDPYERAVERYFLTREGKFTMSGYIYVMNRDPKKTEALRSTHLEHYRWLNEQLLKHNPVGTWLFDRFGLAEAVYTPMFMRFWFLEYYERFELPDTEEYARVKRWKDACMSHPSAQQVTREEILTCYYDYAVGVGNGALPEGRQVSSFTFDPAWDTRPLPPKDKYDRIASDEELGLLIN